MANAKPQLTPVGRSVLEATYRGRVSFLTRPQIVIQRARDEVLDVSREFASLPPGLAYIQPYDLEQPPFEVECLVTPDGEDALMEAAQAARARKATTK